MKKDKPSYPEEVMEEGRKRGIYLDLEVPVPGTLNIIGKHLARAEKLRKAMDKWSRPKEDKELLRQLRELKAMATGIRRNLWNIRMLLRVGVEQQGAVNEILEMEHSHGIACNNYLVRLKRYLNFKGINKLYGGKNE